MKNLMLVLGLLGCFPLALGAEVSKEDLKVLASAGISDGVILSYVRSHGPLAKLSAEDVIELKKAGLKESLLAQLLSVPAPAAPAGVPGSSTTTCVQPAAPYYDSSSVVYDDVTPSYLYGSWDYGYPYYGLGFYGGRYCGYYNGYSCWNRYPYRGGYYGTGFQSGAFVRGSSGASSFHGGFGGGHGGSFGGGGHGGHR